MINQKNKAEIQEQELLFEVASPTLDALNEIKKIIWIIISILVVAFITLLISVCGLIIEAWHFKSSSYNALMEKNVYLEKIISDYKLEQKELKITIEDLRKDINKISDNISSNKPEKE